MVSFFERLLAFFSFLWISEKSSQCSEKTEKTNPLAFSILMSVATRSQCAKDKQKEPIVISEAYTELFVRYVNNGCQEKVELLIDCMQSQTPDFFKLLLEKLEWKSASTFGKFRLLIKSFRLN